MLYDNHYVTGDSFGSDLPENWEEIADFLNGIIDERGIQDDREACQELWEQFWWGDLEMTPPV